jgi:NO-binding membrane sensor protein with MHYT domain/two-component sensor histidine kinase
MTGTYNVWLVALSVVVAVVASYVALDLATRIAAHRRPAARYWLIGDATAMGTGIWSMHYIGMLAYRLPIPMAYDLPLTLWSLLIAIGVSALAFHLVLRSTLSLRRLVAGGVLMGIGIAAMHYTGMAAMEIDPPIRFRPFMVGVSLFVAVAASMTALWSAFSLRIETILSAFWKKTGSALIMGTAISGMHYTGMAAAIFAPDSICTAGPTTINNAWLAVVVAAFALGFEAMVLLAASFDAYLANRSAQQAQSLAKLSISLGEQATELERANAALKREAEERARVEEALREAQQVLEQRVGERTAELARTNRSLLEQIAERRLAEERSKESGARLEQALEEREQVSRDLHDGIVQELYGVGLGLEGAQRLLEPNGNPVRERLAAAIDRLNRVIREVRRHIIGSTPPGMTGRQLVAELESLLETLQGAHSLRFSLDVDPVALSRLSPESTHHVLNIVREAVSNTLRHSQGQTGRVSLRAGDGDGVRLSIEDDGVGFAVAEAQARGQGLRNIALRAEELGARLDVRSSPGHGTEIVLDIPSHLGREPGAAEQSQQEP